MSELIELEIERPMGEFILKQTNIKPVMTPNGAYYHYADVVTLLNLLKESLNKK